MARGLTEELKFILSLETNDAEVRKTLRSVDNVVRKTQQLVTTTKLSEEAQEEANQIFQEANKIYSRFNSTLDKSGKEYGGLVSKQNTLIRSTEQLSLQQKGLGKATNNANQILFSFGDAIQDGAQFQFGFAQGARAIGNNLAFAAEQFAITNQRTGNWVQTLKVLGGSFLGPAGIILAINAAITAITLYGDKIQEFLSINDDLEASLETITEAINDQIKALQKVGLIEGGELERAELALQAAERRVELINEEIEKNRENIKTDIVSTRGAEGLAQRELNSQLQETNERKQEELDVLSDFITATKQEILDLKLKASIIEDINSELVTNAEQVDNAIAQTGEQIGVNRELASTYDIIKNSIADLQAQQRAGVDLSGLPKDDGISGFSPFGIEAGTLQADLLELRTLNDFFLQAGTDAEREAIAQRIGLKQEEIDAKKSLLDQDLENNKANLTQIAQVSSQIVKGLFGDNKAAATATAIIDSYVAFNKALASAPPPFNFALAGAVLASGLAQVKRIQQTKIGSSASGGGASSGASAPVSGATSSATTSTFEAAKTPSGARSQPNFNVTFDTNFSAKGMAQTVRIGEQDIIGNTTTGS